MTRDRLQAIMVAWLKENANPRMLTALHQDGSIFIEDASFDLTGLAQEVFDALVEDL